MTRTIKGSKPIGYDYWSRRPGNQGGGLLGAGTKTLTNRKERAMIKTELEKGKKNGYQD